MTTSRKKHKKQDKIRKTTTSRNENKMILSRIDNKKDCRQKFYMLLMISSFSKINVSNSHPVNLASSHRDERGYL